MEIWKDIAGYEGMYQVSNHGRVKSLDRKVWNGNVYFVKSGRILKPKTATGYSRVELIGKDFYIHRLVAQAFISNKNSDPQVNHKDEKKGNNHHLNLEWCSQRYNNNYGTAIQRRTEKLKGVMINNKPIEKYSSDGCLLNTYESACRAANENKIDNSSICKVANHKAKQAGGFIWRWCS